MDRHTSTVQRYLERLVAHDFDAVAACLAEDVVRVGPFGDTYTPRDRYVAYLSKLMPSLPGYAMHVQRVVGAGPTVLVELCETVEIAGAPLDTNEALVFDLGDDGRIGRITIYIQQHGEPPALAT